MYKKGFFPFIPSPNQCYRFSLYTGCASRVCESAFIRLRFIHRPTSAVMLGPPRNRACRAVNAAGDRVVVRYSLSVLYLPYHLPYPPPHRYSSQGFTPAPYHYTALLRSRFAVCHPAGFHPMKATILGYGTHNAAPNHTHSSVPPNLPKVIA